MPEDVRLKKLAGNLLIMAQSGQYNYQRCVSRNESGAAQLAICEFVRAAQNVIFLLNKRYIPYYKWSFCAMRGLDNLSELEVPLEHLISSPNTPAEIEKKLESVDLVCSKIVYEIRAQELTGFFGAELEGHAYSVNNKIKDPQVRNLHVLYAV